MGRSFCLFPEAFIPAYPRGLSFGMVVGSRSPEGRLTWQRYWENSVDVPGPATEALGEAAREAGVYLAMGVIERDSQLQPAALYTARCSILALMAGCWANIANLKPTAAERLIWGEGDGSTLDCSGYGIGPDGRAYLLGKLYAPGAHGHVRQRG